MDISHTKFYQFLKSIGITRFALKIICIKNDVIRFFYKKILSIRDTFITIKIFFYIIFTNTHTTQQNTKEPSLIISLTSYPKRLNSIHLTLYSLLRQKHKPDKIVLCLAKEEFPTQYSPSFFIRKLIERGINLEWTEKNTKPYNKLLPSLKKYPKATIVICDDDAIYPRNWLEMLYNAHIETPQCIIGHKGFILTLQSNLSLNSYDTLIQEVKKDYANNDTTKYTAPRQDIFLEGVGGILIPPQSFSDEIFNSDIFLRICPHADDIWFNAMAIIHTTPRRVCTKNPRYIPPLIANTQYIGLARINLDKNQNNVQFKQVFDHYALYSHLKP